MTVPIPTPAAFVNQYELLRDRVIAGAGAGSHVGMALLRRSGLTTWMIRASAENETPASPSDRRAARRASVGGDIQPGMVRVLANMALGGLGGTRT